MSLMGFRNLYYAKLTKDDETGVAYETPKRFPGAVSINEEAQSETAKLFADDVLYESMQVFSEGELELVVADLPTNIRVELGGHSIDSATGKITYNVSDVAPYFALMGEFLKGDGTKRYFKLLKGQLSESGLESETKNDSPELRTTTLNGTFAGRKYDGNYKYVVDSTDDNAEYVATWYNSVEDVGGNTPNP